MKFSSPQSSTNCLETAESGDPHIFIHTSLENMQFVSIFSAVCLCPEGERCQGGDVSDRAELVLVAAGRRTGEHKQRCNQYRHIGATISAIVIHQICLIQLSTAFRDIHSAR